VALGLCGHLHVATFPAPDVDRRGRPGRAYDGAGTQLPDRAPLCLTGAACTGSLDDVLLDSFPDLLTRKVVALVERGVPRDLRDIFAVVPHRVNDATGMPEPLAATPMVGWL
jgi:hypothetical protein